MPADRRATFPAAKLVKTERTHEENQERAYIAASRRSDRSLEARIESARRASEIHKKRTGRALRVTEQDVVNEEMYEEEDDDLPTQYQRLNAHLQTSSWLFNRKLHDYIATQHGVRNMFLQQQFPGQGMQPYAAQMQPTNQMPMMNQSMLPPQLLSPAAQGFAQPPQPFSPQAPQHPPQGYRHAPYNIQRRQSAHQRSASMSTLQGTRGFSQPVPQPNSNATTPQPDSNRRMSLPPHVLEQHVQQAGDGQQRPLLSRPSTAQSHHPQPVSPPQGFVTTLSASAPTSGHTTPLPKSEHTTPTNFQFPSLPFNSQVMDISPLSFSLPPESQQFVGSALDPNDSRTAILMAGSDNIPQPFLGTYTYNPNLSPKAGRLGNAVDQPNGLCAPGMTQTLAPENSIKSEPTIDTPLSNSPPSAVTENVYTPQSYYAPTGLEYTNFFDQYQHTEVLRASNDGSFNDTYEENSFVNWD